MDFSPSLTDAAMPLIRLQGIRKSYTLGEVEVHALRGVSLDIDAGRVRRPDGRLRAREKRR